MGRTEITAEPGIPQIIITREFDAPRDLVFRAYTDPELLVRWQGPRELTSTVDYYEARDGGRWRYVSTDPRATSTASTASSTAPRRRTAPCRPSSTRASRATSHWKP